MMDARNIAYILGGDAHGRSVNVPGPGHNKADRSLSIRVDPRAPDGFTLFSHAGDDWQECRDYVRDRLGLGQWRPGIDQSVQHPITYDGPDPAKEKSKGWALDIWSKCVDATGTLVERYLLEHRGLGLNVGSSVVRFHAGLKYDDRFVPGMVCLMRDIKTDEPSGIHRTFLDRKTAEKIDRRMLGIAKGAAIKFDQAGADLTLGEGVESVLSARAVGFAPAWSLGSSGAVGAFPVLRGVKEINLLEENDPNGRSRNDVEACASRYSKAGRPVNVITPDIGKDMNDILRAAQ